MSPLLQRILNELDQLSSEEKQQVIRYLISREHPSESVDTQARKPWQELAGVAPNLSGGLDAQDFVNSLRDEWGSRVN
ncbi:MAG: hypothetical protein NW220_04210 [Leptolyngbyaceae cyanobacterium bins.349]|nr:hypothetical protein [Leptolyngbyaceae cyanobacterium bins.349]